MKATPPRGAVTPGDCALLGLAIVFATWFVMALVYAAVVRLQL